MSSTTSSIEDEEIECPVCHGVVKPFYIGLNKVLLMCKEKNCTFPYGEKDISVYVSPANEIKYRIDDIRKRMSVED